MKVKSLAQEHNIMTQPGLEPGPLDPESSALTTKPPHLPQQVQFKLMTIHNTGIQYITIVYITTYYLSISQTIINQK